jgi:hypothetical protein
MRSRLLASLIGLMVVACSAPERANPTPRCKASSDCGDGHICYRDFCIPFDEPDMSAEGGAPTDPPPPADAATELPGALDSSLPTPTNDAEAKPSLDANMPPPPPRAEAGQMVDPGPEPDSAVAPIADAASPAQDANVSPEPPTDAGSVVVEDASVVDASSVNVQLELTRCLGICGAAQQLCMTCFRQLVNRNPEICLTTGTSGTDTIVRTLCQAYCRTPRCEAP